MAGTWSYLAIGWTVPNGASVPVPVTGIGVGVIDNAGNVTGPGTWTSGAPIPGTPLPAGQPLDIEVVNATIQINEDCTGIFKYDLLLKGLPIPPLGPYIERIIFDRGHDEVISMSVQAPTGKPMWTYT